VLGERRGFRFGGGQFGFGAGDVEVVADAAVETAADQLHLFLAQINRAGHGGDFGVERPEPEIILRDVGLERQQHIAEMPRARPGHRRARFQIRGAPGPTNQSRN
jgi:hypothetical protein